VVCGQSIFSHALEVALVEDASVDVARLHPCLPLVVERIAALCPVVVLLERHDGHAELALALLNLGIPVVETDVDTGQGILLTAYPVSLTSRPDLKRLLERLGMVASGNPVVP
jgi:hypothetical protein